MQQRQFDRAWATWVALSAASCTGLEIAALRSGDVTNTLSAHLRAWFGIRPHEPREPYAMLAAAAFLGGCAWPGLHIAFEMWALPVHRWLGGDQPGNGQAVLTGAGAAVSAA